MSEPIHLWIHGKPIPWKAHAGYGRRSYSPNYEHKERYREIILSQYAGPLITDCVKIDATFFLPYPKSLKNKDLFKIHTLCSRPDTTNLFKFLEDCLQGTVIADDNQTRQIVAIKTYWLGMGATEVKIESIRDITLNATHKG